MKKSFLKLVASVFCGIFFLTACSQAPKAYDTHNVSFKKDAIATKAVAVSATEVPDEIIVFVPKGGTTEAAPIAEEVPDEIIVFLPEGSAEANIEPVIVDEYTNAQKNVIIEGEVVSADTGLDLSTLDKVYNYADVVVVGTVSSVGISQYRSDRFLPYTVTKISCEQVLKGKADKEATFSFAGGYVPAAQYLKKQAERSKGKNDTSTFSDDQIKNGYARIKINDSPELQIGKQYVVFLSREENGELTAIGSNYSVLLVENGKYKDYEGKIQVVAPRK